jgi:hypothetical protein
MATLSESIARGPDLDEAVAQLKVKVAGARGQHNRSWTSGLTTWHRSPAHGGL